MELYHFLPIIEALKKSDLTYGLGGAYADLISYLLESEEEAFLKDLAVYKYLNSASIEERENYITQHFSSYDEYDNLGVLASIDSESCYTCVLYDWKNNQVYYWYSVSHISPISAPMPLPDLISIMQDWLHYCDTGFLPEPIVDKNTTEGLDVLIDFYQHHDQTNSVVQEKIAFYTNQKNIIVLIKKALPLRIAALETLTKSRPLLAREQLELDSLQSILAARDIAEIDALLAKISNTPTDAELRKRLIAQAEAKRDLILDNNI